MLSLSAPERPCALPLGKDTHNLEINPLGGGMIRINRWLPKALPPPSTPPGLTPY